MGFSIKDFINLEFKLKSIVISLALLMPFWYVALYLFDRPFIINNPFYTVAIFSFALSVPWCGFGILFGFLYFEKLQFKKELERDEKSDDIPFLYGGIYSIVILLVSIFVHYSKNLIAKSNGGFYIFIVFSYSVFLIVIISYFLKNLIGNHKKKQN
jgi:hypothetical protein